MAKKYEKVVLTVKQMLELIEMFENGESATILAKDYGVGIQIVCDIKINKMKLMEFVGTVIMALDLPNSRV
jgi:hypothetical protein